MIEVGVVCGHCGQEAVHFNTCPVEGHDWALSSDCAACGFHAAVGSACLDCAADASHSANHLAIPVVMMSRKRYGK